jgi:ankyrin repeat protein
MQNLHELCQHKNLNGIRELLSTHNNISEIINSRDIAGFTPIQYACIINPNNFNRFLIINGINNISDNEDNLNNYFETCTNIIQLLLDNSADLTIQNYFNSTAIHIICNRPDTRELAYMMADVDILEILLKKSNLTIDFIDFTNFINSQDINGNTPLNDACSNNLTEIVELLLTYGADPNLINSQNQTSLHVCLRNPDCSPDLVRSLTNAMKSRTMNTLDSKNYTGNTALQITCSSRLYKKAEIVQILMDAGCDASIPNNEMNETALHLCASYKTHGSEALEILLSSNNKTGIKAIDKPDVYGNTPLHKACRYNNVELVRILIKYKCNVLAKNEYGITPLHSLCCILDCDLEIVKILLSQRSNLLVSDQMSQRSNLPSSGSKATYLTGSQIGQINDMINARDEEHCTPLYHACKNRLYDIVVLLIDANCDISLKNKFGDTALHVCCSNMSLINVIQPSHINSSSEIVKLLLQTAINTYGLLAVEKVIDVTNNFNVAPIHYANHFNYVEIVKLLADAGATLK